MANMPSMVTDRSQSDVERAEYILGLSWSNMTSSEQQEFLELLKGSYNYTDLNRVETAVGIIADLLSENGYLVDVTINTKWNNNAIPSYNDMTRYLGNIKKLIDSFHVKPTSPSLPTSMNNLTHETANNIEQILADIYENVNNMIQILLYSDEVYCGED